MTVDPDIKQEYKKNSSKEVQVTIDGSGSQGKKEVIKLMHQLCKLRKVKILKRQTSKEKRIVTLEAKREEDFTKQNNEKIDRIKPKIKASDYLTSQGYQLILEENNSGITATLVEDFNHEEASKEVERLAKLVSVLTRNSKITYEQINGEKRKVIINTSGSKVNPDNDGNLESRLYQNLSLTLLKRLEEIEKEKSIYSPGLMDDITHYTHMPLEETRKVQERAKLAYFLRELYGLVQIRSKNTEFPNGLTTKEIQSSRKTGEITKQRSIMMYIVRHAFPGLSSTKIGIIFGRYGKPKNHATVIIDTKDCKGGKFDGSVGINPKNYPQYSAKELYEDATKKYNSAKKRKTR